MIIATASICFGKQKVLHLLRKYISKHYKEYDASSRTVFRGTFVKLMNEVLVPYGFQHMTEPE